LESDYCNITFFIFFWGKEDVYLLGHVKHHHSSDSASFAKAPEFPWLTIAVRVRAPFDPRIPEYNLEMRVGPVRSFKCWPEAGKSIHSVRVAANERTSQEGRVLLNLGFEYIYVRAFALFGVMPAGPTIPYGAPKQLG